jgi:hypothetical protein
LGVWEGGAAGEEGEERREIRTQEKVGGGVECVIVGRQGGLVQKKRDSCMRMSSVSHVCSEDVQTAETTFFLLFVSAFFLHFFPFCFEKKRLLKK